jgi:hypothetical protein
VEFAALIPPCAAPRRSAGGAAAQGFDAATQGLWIGRRIATGEPIAALAGGAGAVLPAHAAVGTEAADQLAGSGEDEREQPGGGGWPGPSICEWRRREAGSAARIASVASTRRRNRTRATGLDWVG